MREFVSERIRNRYVAELTALKRELGEVASLRNARLIERRLHLKCTSLAIYRQTLK